MTARYRVTAIVTLLTVMLALPLFVQAWSPGEPIVPSNCDQAGGCPTICAIPQLASNLLSFAIYLAVLSTAALFMWDGWKFLTAITRGQPAEIATAKKVLWHIVFGLVSILVLYFVVDFVVSFVANGWDWKKIC